MSRRPAWPAAWQRWRQPSLVRRTVLALLFRVEGADGVPLHASPALAAVPSGTGTAGAGADADEVEVAGRRYWRAQQRSPRWRVQVLEPVITDAEVLLLLGTRLFTPMLIAFPFVLLPLWFAVRGGLRPLRELARAVARRDPADFSPLGLRPRHAELQPLAAALDGLLERAHRGIEHEKAFVQEGRWAAWATPEAQAWVSVGGTALLNVAMFARMGLHLRRLAAASTARGGAAAQAGATTPIEPAEAGVGMGPQPIQ